jgi:hypothetical protein
MAGSENSMTDTYTMGSWENVFILSRDKDKQVTQFQSIMRKDILDCVIEYLHAINGELR